MIAKILFVSLLWKGILAPAPIFDLRTCSNGCKTRDDCTENAACIPAVAATCGLCVCTVGFSPVGDKCVSTGSAPSSPSGLGTGPFSQQVPPRNHPTDNGNSDANGNSNGASSNSETDFGGGIVPAKGNGFQQGTSIGPGAPTTPQSVPPSNNGGGGGGGGDGNNPSDQNGFDCSRYKCDSSNGNGKDCSSDAAPSPVQCPNLVGGGQCMLGSCLKINSSASYCLCPYARQSRTCHVKKTGACDGSSGNLPPDATTIKGKRFRHMRDADSGAVLARHAVDSLSDCLRLCQWATFQQCRSFNFGTVNGQKICELLTVWANKDSVLFQWLKDDPDWSYTCCLGTHS